MSSSYRSERSFASSSRSIDVVDKVFAKRVMDAVLRGYLLSPKVSKKYINTTTEMRITYARAWIGKMIKQLEKYDHMNGITNTDVGEVTAQNKIISDDAMAYMQEHGMNFATRWAMEVDPLTLENHAPSSDARNVIRLMFCVFSAYFAREKGRGTGGDQLDILNMINEWIFESKHHLFRTFLFDLRMVYLYIAPVGGLGENDTNTYVGRVILDAILENNTLHDVYARLAPNMDELEQRVRMSRSALLKAIKETMY